MSNVESLVKNGSYWYPQAASEIASSVDSLFYFVFWISLILFGGIVFFTLYFCYKYKRTKSNLVASGQLTHSLLLELSWTIIPLIILMGVFFWGFNDYLKLMVPPSNAIEIRVVGKKWFWSFEYPKEGIVSVGEVVVPVDTPIKFIMTSTDVLHSFYLPNFRTKKDCVPNRYSRVYIHPNRLGIFQIFCTEYCGDAHSNMLATLKVVSKEDYKIFLESSSVDDDIPLPELGEKLYVKNACNTCHSIDGSRIVGPTWKGLFNSERKLVGGSAVIADEEYLVESILDPMAKVVEGYPAVMPSYSGLLKEREIAAIIEYIKSIK